MNRSGPGGQPASAANAAHDALDVASELPAHGIPIDMVGVERQQAALLILEPLAGRSLDLLCDLSAAVSLRRDRRGIHMSRIIEAIPRDRVERTLLETAMLVADRTLTSQAQEHSRVRLTTTLPLDTLTHVTGLRSPDTVELSAVARAGALPGGGISLCVRNLTACPCMQRYTASNLARELGLPQDQAARLAQTVPIATHTQRGTVRLTALSRDPTRLPGFEDLYGVVLARTTLVQDLLKRPDEYDVLVRSHRNAQFVEDVVRDVADELGLSLGRAARRVDGECFFEVLARSHESIHAHDVWAAVRLGDEQLSAQLNLPNDS